MAAGVIVSERLTVFAALIMRGYRYSEIHIAVRLV